MSSSARSSAPWILWPLAAIWDLFAFILKVTGRVVGVILALVLMILGGVLTVTVLGAPVGIPLAVFGFLLLIRSLF